MKTHVEQAIDEQLACRDARLDGEPLYTVTYYNRLSSIADEGLVPNAPRAIGSPAYDAHAKGKVFLTEPDGVDFWMGRAEAFAEHNSDNAYEDGLVPIVLRVAGDCFEAQDLVQDPHGTRDALTAAWMTKLDFVPECLEVYTGKRWAPIEDWDEIDPLAAFNVEDDPDVEVEDRDEDGEPKKLYYFKYTSPFNPELP